MKTEEEELRQTLEDSNFKETMSKTIEDLALTGVSMTKDGEYLDPLSEEGLDVLDKQARDEFSQMTESIMKVSRFVQPYLDQMIIIRMKINHLRDNSLDKTSPKFNEALEMMESSYEYYNDLVSETIKKKTTVIKENEYMCAMCENVYQKGWSEEDAHQECVENFGEDIANDKDNSVICDDCYQKIIPKEHPQEVLMVKLELNENKISKQ